MDQGVAVKSGRNRKSGPRYPSGDIKIAEESDYSPTAVKRLVDASIAGASNPMWATPFGRMHLEGRFTYAEYAAGRRWDSLRRQYLIAIDASGSDPKSAAMELGRGGNELDPDSYAGIRVAKQHIASVKEFSAAYKALRGQGPLAAFVVEFLCKGEGRRIIRHEEFLAAKKGLQALAQFFAGSR
jgi:hypothetical protein